MTFMRDIGGGRGKFVCDAVETPVEKILDIGCSYGWTLAALAGKATCLVGIDMDERAIDQARSNYPHIIFTHQTAKELPYASEEFDVVVLADVIEHVGDANKQQVIDEAYRVLKKNGTFIFTAPYAGLFAWADPMDFKRRMPGIYRLYSRISHYNPTDDIEQGHKHVTYAEILRLFGDRFDVRYIRFCGLLTPLISWVLVIGERLRILPRRVCDGLNRLRAWESGVPYPRSLSFFVRLVAEKR